MPDPGEPATLAHVLAVQGVLRMIFVMLIRSGTVSRDEAADMLKAHAVEIWAEEVRRLGTFAG